jgi:hypothetical protein
VTRSAQIRNRLIAPLLCALFAIIPANGQQKPAVAVDLKPLGAAPDLFTDQSDSKYQQRGTINLFWLGDDRLAVAFSSNRRWSPAEKPEPLRVRLAVFDAEGKRLASRDWSFGAEGPEGGMTLELAPGPDDSILAIHESSANGKIPDGNFVQVLNVDATPRQVFYIPATSAWVPAILPEPRLVLETYYANKRSSLSWWSGKPLKAGPRLDLPPGKEETLAGPEVAARADCVLASFCSGIRVFKLARGELAKGQLAEGELKNGKAGNAPTSQPETFRLARPDWNYNLPSPDTVPLPRLFLTPTALLVELRPAEKKQSDLVVLHPNAPPTPLPSLPRGLQILGATGVSRDGRRFALSASGEVGICGAFNLWCNQRGEALVIDVPSGRIIFQQEISASGGASSLSPDGKRLAVFDRDKLAIYMLP